MKYEFHPEALAEYEETAHCYAGCQEGLELRFITAIEHAIQQILEAPERWRILEFWKIICDGVSRAFFLIVPPL